MVCPACDTVTSQSSIMLSWRAGGVSPLIPVPTEGDVSQIRGLTPPARPGSSSVCVTHPGTASARQISTTRLPSRTNSPSSAVRSARAAASRPMNGSSSTSSSGFASIARARRARRVWPFESVMNGCADQLRDAEPPAHVAPLDIGCVGAGSQELVERQRGVAVAVRELEPLLVVAARVREKARVFLKRYVGNHLRRVIDLAPGGAEAVEQRPAEAPAAEGMPAEERLGERALPAAGRPDDGPRLALAHRPVEVIEDRVFVAKNGRVRQFEDCRHVGLKVGHSLRE